jgi:hypothetical protein
MTFRFVPIDPERAGKLRALKSASFLHDFLIQHQTSRDGLVNYGRAISYRWILAKWPGDGANPPTIRTLQRYMRKLKDLGFVEVRVLPFGHGMIVRLLLTAKWRPALPATATQLDLFRPNPVEIRRGKAVEERRKSCEEAEEGEALMTTNLSSV